MRRHVKRLGRRGGLLLLLAVLWAGVAAQVAAAHEPYDAAGAVLHERIPLAWRVGRRGRRGRPLRRRRWWWCGRNERRQLRRRRAGRCRGGQDHRVVAIITASGDTYGQPVTTPRV